VIFRQYVFHPPLAERPFLIPAAKEKMPEIMEALNAALDELIQE
jgi:hypothetical protein